MPVAPGAAASIEEQKAKVLLEKKTVINLIEAFGVSVKHYLRGEDGIFYEDLYHLVKFLPPYALPAGLPSAVDLSQMPTGRPSNATRHSTSRNEPKKSADGGLPLPVTSEPRSPTSRTYKGTQGDDLFLLPARNPPQFAIFDVFPFSLLVRQLTKRGKDVKGKKAARLRATMEHADSHNIPLEISFYLVRLTLGRPSRFCAHLTDRVPTSLLCKIGRRLTRPRPVRISMENSARVLLMPHLAGLLNTVLSLTDSLTGLERILTTPIPFSYSIHLWVVTVFYCLALPFQILGPLGWITIPGTTVVVRGAFGSVYITPLIDYLVPGLRLLWFSGCW
jgi:putative membrane protein